MTPVDFASATPPLCPAETMPTAVRASVGVATRGRPDHVRQLVHRLRRQSLRPAAIVVVCAEPSDVSGLPPAPDLEIVYSAPGLTKQRNVVLDHVLAGSDYVIYFDDDFVPDDNWLALAVAHFEADSSIACVTGNVIADGILGPGLTLDDAESALRCVDPTTLDWQIDGYSPYGCNMAFRSSSIRSLRFDERLILYGWLEDRDFGSRVAATGGRLIKIGAAFGVHLGVKRGRLAGKRLGYSQVINPSYMFAKGTISRRNAVKTILRNVSANFAKFIWPEDYVDRRGRLMGNALGIVDLLKGLCQPERAELW